MKLRHKPQDSESQCKNGEEWWLALQYVTYNLVTIQQTQTQHINKLHCVRMIGQNTYVRWCVTKSTGTPVLTVKCSEFHGCLSLTKQARFIRLQCRQTRMMLTLFAVQACDLSQRTMCSNTLTSHSSQNLCDAFRGQSRSPNIVLFHMLAIVGYSFLLCNSNFVLKTCHFSYIRLSKMLWPWNLGQRSLKVIESGTIR